MTGPSLDYPALMELARRRAEHDARLMWDPETQEERYQQALARLINSYYLQLITPR
jgi:hypothetical protein